jgi:hypothetical protein
MRALGTSFASAIAGVLLASLVTSAGVPTEMAFVLVMLLGAGAAIVALVIVGAIPPRPAPVASTTTPAPQAEPENETAPLVRGTVRHGGGPAGGAVLTVVSSDGHQLGSGRTADDGAFTLRRTGDGRPHLLVVQWSGIARAEPLAGTDGLVRDVELGDRVPVPAR